MPISCICSSDSPHVDIPAIRQSQEFVSQRYLNLTTIATFLSSVTATTLQISAGSSDSILATVTNTFWFISLVFSAASAVYSLLEMTWRRSPVYLAIYMHALLRLTTPVAADRNSCYREWHMPVSGMGPCSR